MMRLLRNKREAGPLAPSSRGGLSGLRVLVSLFLLGPTLAACDSLPGWMGGKPPVIKRAPGERTDVIVSPDSLRADESLKDVPVEVPDQTNLAEWKNGNEAMLTPHVGLTGVAHEQSATIGDGNSFSRNVVSTPVIADGLVFAMDASGVVSAHNEVDISDVKWTDATGRDKNIADALGGGLTYDDKVIYATTGLGTLRALDAQTGKVKWNIRVGAPVRGAPAVSGGLVVVLTADNQTLAYDAATGAPRWDHRGIRETAGYFSTTAPVISEGVVVSAYSSGEIFALRLETGSVLWSDTLSNTIRTKAAAVFSGIDANPIVQEGVVIVASTSGLLQASALLNGRPLWQAKVGTHMTPWSAGNVIYVISDTHDIAAIMKRDGSVRWATSLAVKDKVDPKKDKTPPLYGPILSANAVLVVNGNGDLTSVNPTNGERIASYELAGGIVTAPIVANGAMYVVTKDARLKKYY